MIHPGQRPSILSRLYRLFDRREADRIVHLWRQANMKQPEILLDIAFLGGLTEDPTTRPLTPEALAFDAGRRAMALQIMARMTATPDDLTEALEILHDTGTDRDDRDDA